MTVGVDCSAVETALRGGELRCPVLGCAGRLAPWGWARARSVRGAAGRLRPRRAMCTGCGRTHVLLPASVLLRRADAVTVIGAALGAKAGGWGHRRVAARVDRPPSTVRGWLRRIGRVADRVLAVLGVVAAELGTEFVPPAPTGEPVGSVVELVGSVVELVGSVVELVGSVVELARAVARRLGGSCSPWRLAAVVCGGRLLTPAGPDLGSEVGVAGNTSWLWAGER